MTDLFSVFVPALLIGLLGAGHCFGMCGGIASALTFALGDDVSTARKTGVLLSYSAGRIFSYMLVGASLAFALSFLPDSVLQYVRRFAGVLLILMGLYISGWWKILVVLERAGAKLWQFLQPIGSRMLPVRSNFQGFLFGVIWGWLPCGLVYTAALYAASQARFLDGALSMLGFGLGTLPAILSIGVLAGALKGLLQSRGFRAASGLVLIAFGVWTFWGMGHGSHGTAHLEEGSNSDATHEHHHHH